LPLHCPDIAKGDVKRGQSIAPPNIAFGDVRQCKGKTFLHRLLYITEGYVCDVWQCITPKG